jgi:hypothetical protein
MGDIGFAVQNHAESNGFGVVKDLVGHGVGKNLHEAPEVPNYGKRGQGIQLLEGLSDSHRTDDQPRYPQCEAVERWLDHRNCRWKTKCSL